MSGNELDRLARAEAARRLPPLPPNRMAGYVEDALAYRGEYTIIKGVEMGDRLADGVARLHHENERRAEGDPRLGQFLDRITATVTLAGCDLIGLYMEHPYR